MSGKEREAIIIRIVETQFVETDVKTFKSVVQSLTGRESNMTSMVGAMANSSRLSPMKVRVRREGEGGEEEGLRCSPQQNLQLENFEKMFLELPPLDELVFWF